MKDLERICEESYCRLFLRFKMFFDLLLAPVIVPFVAVTEVLITKRMVCVS